MLHGIAYDRPFISIYPRKKDWGDGCKGRANSTVSLEAIFSRRTWCSVFVTRFSLTSDFFWIYLPDFHLNVLEVMRQTGGLCPGKQFSLPLSRLLCLDIRNSTMTLSTLHIFLPLLPLPLVPFPRPHERCVSPSGPQTLFQGCQLCLRLDGSGSYGLMPPTGECFLCLLVIVLRGGHSNHFF